ncbi:hypothetical protein EIP91_004905 [Steccherinum ochraceum]|uniref:Uncharacterized protein n=1 Tax=Steccherinum ochraceum TaxID=92696 RepID=A0A4R0RJ74_9APHY|nr:hypothetical protein EIP91_004905 [Steccherinum ochraceum]
MPGPVSMLFSLAITVLCIGKHVSFKPRTVQRIDPANDILDCITAAADVRRSAAHRGQSSLRGYAYEQLTDVSLIRAGLGSDVCGLYVSRDPRTRKGHVLTRRFTERPRWYLLDLGDSKGIRARKTYASAEVALDWVLFDGGP